MVFLKKIEKEKKERKKESIFLHKSLNYYYII